MRKTSEFVAILSLTAIAIMFALAPLAQAQAKHWLSGNRLVTPKGDATIQWSDRLEGSIRIFDIVISLHNNPSGDDDPLTIDERTPYEEALGYFADAVFESTEGAHKIGRISIYTDGDHASMADIIWKQSGHPATDFYDIKLAGHIYMYDVFDKYHLNNDDLYFLSGPSGPELAGYTLAHEWGHHTYGLGDEYWMQVGDLPVNYSIMNAQSLGLSDKKWLNFSIPKDPDSDADWEDTGKTDQHRTYGASCWETMKRNFTLDPKFILGRILNHRTYFAELAQVAPISDPAVQLPDAQFQAEARNELQIRWMTDTLVYQIVLDRSGSMDQNNKLENAKEAAAQLVEVATIGKTYIGVKAFNTSVSTVYPITLIDSDDDKAAIKAAIAGISASGGTAVYVAANAALNDLIPLDDKFGKVVFLLTDGLDSSSGEDDVIANYQANRVPLFTFAYGSDADVGSLSRMAVETSGKFYYSPITLAAITAAFTDAKMVVTSSGSIDSGGGSQTLAPFAQLSMDFPVDSAVGGLMVTITHSGVPENIIIDLLDPIGTSVAYNEISPTSTDTTYYFRVDSPQVGIWQIEYTSMSPDYVYVTTRIDAEGNETINYALSAISVTGSTVLYPAPFLVMAALEKDLPIVGANVLGYVEDPTGQVSLLSFRDDGVAPDYLANDGKYSAETGAYDTNGIYKVRITADNETVTAYLTDSCLRSAIREDGSIPEDITIPISEAFRRSQVIQVLVQGVVPDDHGNEFGAATAIVADNTDHWGRMETTDDSDFFAVTIPEPLPTGAVFRITNMTPGLVPVLTIYDQAHNQLGQTTFIPGGDYISLPVVLGGATLFYASVQTGADSTIGTYSISAGPQLISDLGETPTVVTSDISSVTSSTAVSGGEVTADGGAEVIARGVCWNIAGSPTIADPHTTDGAGTGAFVSNITGLATSQTYYVRAYATSSAGTGYGNELQLTTGAYVSPRAPAHKVIYSSDETGDGEIFVVFLNSDLDVISKVNVSNSPTSGEGYPRWSPDGTRIAFQSDYDGTAQMWVMNADGSGKRRVTDAALPVAPISWSVNGLYVQALMANPGDGEMVQVNVETGEITPLTDVSSYNTQHWDLNADGTKVAYVRGYEGNGFSNELYIADFAFSGMDFTNKVHLSNAVPAPHSPRFSPSGTRIAVHLDRLSPWGEGIGIIDTDNTDFWTPIPVEGMVNQTPEWIDENRLIYAHGAYPESDLYILNLGDLTQKLITDAAGTQGYSDVFSYSQNTTAFKALYSSDETGDGEIFLVHLNSDLDVISKVNVSNSPTSGEGYARWSPDGTRIAYQSDYDGTAQMWVMNADGSGKRRVTDAALPVAPISWSVNGLYVQALMANPGDGEMVQVNVETGEITPLTDVSSYNTQHWDLNTDGTKVAYVRGYEGNGFSNELYIADFAFSEMDFTNKVHLSNAVPAPHSPRFSPSGTRIAVHLDRLSPWGEGIGIIDTDNTDFWTPIPVEGMVNQTPEWIDENRLIYAHGAYPESDLYILNLGDLTQKLITDAAGTQGYPDALLVEHPDLAVGISHNPTNPTTADDIIFTAIVTNVGGVLAPFSTLHVWIGGETDGNSYPIPALAAGASYSFDLPAVNFGNPGPYGVTAIADFTGVVAESNELNNSGHDLVNVTFPAMADLIVESLTLTPPYPIAGENIRFAAVVRNIGTGPAAASVLRMRVGGETEGTDHAIPLLNPGESHEVTRDAALSANPYRTTAQADYTAIIAESNEANNENFVDFDVISADLVAHKLVYSSDETGDGEIFVIGLDINLDVLFKYNVTNRTSGEGYPRWSPNGDRIAFQSDFDGSGQTWVMNADGNDKRRVTDESLSIAPICWSNDGQYIYALMANPGDGEVVQINVDTGVVTALTNVPGYNTQHWDLNLNQTKIAYVRGYEGNGFSNELYIADFAFSSMDFTNKVLLSAAAPAPHSPRLSPSGTRIAVHLDRLSPWGEGIGIIGADGSNFWTPIPVEGYLNQTPEWIDENWIIYAHGTNPAGNLFVLNLNNMTQKQITSDSGYQGFPDIFSYTAPVPPYSRKVDFNSDGQEDILWRYYGGGGYQGLNLVWLMGQMAQPAPMASASPQVQANIDSILMGATADKGSEIRQRPIKSVVAGDRSCSSATRLKLNDPISAGRGKSSAEQQDATSRLSRMNTLIRTDASSSAALGSDQVNLAAIGIAQEVVFSQVADTAWEIAGTGDFNGDTKTDILWRNYGTGGYQGLNDIWFMDGTMFVSESVFSQIPDTNWRIAGTGDFNGDEETDILWRYYGTGAYQGLNVIWYMNDATFVGETVFSQVLDTDWRIEGTGDFNGDGETDILWRFYGTGAYQGLNDIWFMNDAAFVSEAVFSQILDTNWQIGGTGDFNNDGHTDILWRYYGTGAYQGLNDIWYMNGTSFVSEEVFSQVSDINWRIVNR